MTTLTSILTDSRAVSPKRIRDAIQRQVVSGTSLEFVLLDMGAIDEDRLNKLRAQVWNLRGATRNEVMNPSAEALRLVPRSVAKHFGFIPLSFARGKLIVAAQAPVPDDAHTPLGFLLGYDIETRISNEVRISAALAKHYDVEVPDAVRKLLQTLDEQAQNKQDAAAHPTGDLQRSRGANAKLQKPNPGKSRSREFATANKVATEKAATASGPQGPVNRSTVEKQPAIKPYNNRHAAPAPMTGSTDALTMVQRLEATTQENYAEVFAELQQQSTDAYLPQLQQRFPGRLWRKDLGKTSAPLTAREISPIVRAMGEIGRPAEPYIAELLASESPQVRFYATLIASEIPAIAFIEQMGQRVFDADPEVRVLAIKGLRRFELFPIEYERILEGLRAVALGQEYLVDARKVAIFALAQLEDRGSLGTFVELLGLEETVLATTAQGCLEEICFQNFGKDQQRWTDWAATQDARTRIDWMIDALMHSEQSIRARAFASLLVLSKQNFDYHPSLGQQDRADAQQRFRHWAQKQR